MKFIYSARTSAYYFIAFQASFVLVCSGIGALVGGSPMAYSAFLGGMICVLANTCFTLCALKVTGARFARRIVNQFYRAEALKWLVTLGLLAGVIPLFKPSIGPFLLMYSVTTLLVWLSPFFFKSA